MMNTPKKARRIDIWHNILWSPYKGEIFSSLHKISPKEEFDIRFFQIAETAGNRSGLSGIDLGRHRYPYALVFKGSLDNVSLFRRAEALLRHTVSSDADLTILAGYEKIEYWIQLALLKLKHKKIGVFCDSTMYDHKQSFLKGLLKKVVFCTVNGIFCYGKRSKEYVMAYGARAERVYPRCQAAALPYDYTQENALAERNANAPKPDAPRYLYVGRLSPEKGLDTLIKAFTRVKTLYENASLCLIGGGIELQELQQLAQKLHVDDSVIFAGSKSGKELFQAYSGASCLILPSRSEPWGLVVNEALAYGCPVIASLHCGCVPELIVDGVTGYTHTTDDVEDLTRKMLLAPKHFSDITATALNCMQLISGFSPEAAASEILYGIRNILSRPQASI